MARVSWSPLVPRAFGGNLYEPPDRPEVGNNLRPEWVPIPVFFRYPTDIFFCGSRLLAYYVHPMANCCDVAPSRDQLIHEIRNLTRRHRRSQESPLILNQQWQRASGPTTD